MSSSVSARMTTDRHNKTLQPSLVKLKQLFSKCKQINECRQNRYAYVENGEQRECYKRWRGPRAPSNDKSYLYNAAVLLTLRSVLLQPNGMFEYNKPPRPATNYTSCTHSQARPSSVSKWEFTSPIFAVNILGCRYECQSWGFLSPLQWSVSI